MSVGSIMIGIAVLAVVTAYLARPFRRTASADLDRRIEAWVAQMQAEELGLMEQRRRVPGEGGGEATERGMAAEAVNYCPQCGRRVGRDDRFCSGCGERLQEDAA